MVALFTTGKDIRKYLLKAAEQPENIQVMADGKQYLNYRNLNIKVGVVCYVFTQDQILILQRSPTVKFSGQWGTVSGYIDDLELIRNSNQFCRDHLIQEFSEEIGWTIDEPRMLKYCGTHTLIQPQRKVHFELFSLSLSDEPPAIVLNSEHLCSRWVEVMTIKTLRPILVTQFLEGLERVAVTHRNLFPSHRLATPLNQPDWSNISLC